MYDGFQLLVYSLVPKIDFYANLLIFVVPFWGLKFVTELLILKIESQQIIPSSCLINL